MNDAIKGVSLAVSEPSRPITSKIMSLQQDCKPVVTVNPPQQTGRSSSETGESSGERSSTEADGNGYTPFITDGLVSLVGSSVQVPIKILRDTGASESFILESVLPFSTKTSTGTNVLVRGIGLEVLAVPLHKINLQSDLVQGVLNIAVRPSLPVGGIHLLLGNNLAGERVWGSVPPPVIVNTTPVIPDANEASENVPDVFPACAVTRAMSRTFDVPQTELKPVMLPKLPSPLSPSDFAAAQKEDDTLKELFEWVLPPEELRSAARGYFVQDGLLVRKWSYHTDKGVEDPVFQIVVPTKFREVVLKTAHGDVAGHLGVRKTYNRLLKYFYWPRLKKMLHASLRRAMCVS